MRLAAAAPIAALAAALLAAAPAGAAAPKDPLNSVLWDYVHEQILEGAPVVFDDRVQVFAPAVVEDGRLVPVSVRAEGIPGVTQILVFADLNPIPRAVQLEPLKVEPFVALRMKVNEGTAIRAAVRTLAGLWHLGGTVVAAPGGGCAAPRLTAGDADWEDHLGEVRGRAWTTADGGERLRILIRHPMDTGLVDGIPEFFVERITVTDGGGDEIARMQVWSAMSTDPVLTLELPPAAAGQGGFTVQARDSDANEFAGSIPAPATAMPPVALQEVMR